MNAPFVVERSRKYRKTNAQFNECRRSNRPLVTVRPKRKFASIELDMFTTDRNLDERTMDAICEVFAEHTTKVWQSRISCRAERILKSSAENVAARVYDIAFAAMPRLCKLGTLQPGFESCSGHHLRDRILIKKGSDLFQTGPPL